MQPAHANNVEWVHALKRKIIFGILSLVAVSIASAMIFIVVTLRTSILHDSARQTQHLGDVVKSTLRIMMLKEEQKDIGSRMSIKIWRDIANFKRE
jgi:hypothetical protein